MRFTSPNPTAKNMKPNFRDSLNLLRKLTPRRAWNALLIGGSFYLSKWAKKPLMAGLPVSIAMEPTTSCNLRCPECPSGLRSFTRPTGMLQDDMFKKTIDELADTLLYLTFYFQGEPYLHPRFTELVSYAANKGIYTATSTNAHYLDDENARKTVESGLDRLIVSVDGTTQETYASYRIGGKLEKALQGIRNVAAWRKKLGKSTPYLVFQFLVVKPNEHQIEDAKKLAAETGADQAVFKTAQIYDHENGSPLLTSIDRYSRYRQMPDGKYKIKNNLDDSCWKMWHSCVITWDGRAVPCCFDKDAAHPMGQLGTASFKEIWTGEKYNAFRQQLFTSRSQTEMCRNCTEGGQIWG